MARGDAYVVASPFFVSARATARVLLRGEVILLLGLRKLDGAVLWDTFLSPTWGVVSCSAFYRHSTDAPYMTPLGGEADDGPR